VFDKAKLTQKHAGLYIAGSLEAAILRAKDLVSDAEPAPAG
jgi:hypothetical protein